MDLHIETQQLPPNSQRRDLEGNSGQIPWRRHNPARALAEGALRAPPGSASKALQARDRSPPARRELRARASSRLSWLFHLPVGGKSPPCCPRSPARRGSGWRAPCTPPPLPCLRTLGRARSGARTSRSSWAEGQRRGPGQLVLGGGSGLRAHLPSGRVAERKGAWQKTTGEVRRSA